MRLDHLLSMENRSSINGMLRVSSYSDYSAGRKNRTETDLGGKYERGVTRFVRKDLVVQFSMIDKTIIETVKATLKWGCSSAGRAPALQAGGHGFDSHHLHQPAEPAKVIRISALE